MCLPARLETLSLLGSAIPAELDGIGLESSNQVPNRDFRHLLEAVALLRTATSQQLPTGLAADPLDVTRDEVDVLMEEPSLLDVVETIGAKLNAINNLPRAATRLLNLVGGNDGGDGDGMAIKLPPQLFKGYVGNRSLVSELVHQIDDRVLMLRGLLQLTDIASRHVGAPRGPLHGCRKGRSTEGVRR